MFRFLHIIIFISLFGNLIITVSGSDKPQEVFTSIPPIAFLVEQIGGKSVRVNSIIDKNGDPHSYTPTPKQVVELGRAKIFFTIGVPFEQTLVGKIKSLSKPPVIVDLTKGVQFREMKNDHGHNERVNHGEKQFKDPHVWLGPGQIKIIAGNICNALVAEDVANSARYKKNYQVFIRKLNALDAEIAKLLTPFKGKKVFVFHPSFGYFTDAFGLKQEAVEIEGKSPSPRQIINLINESKKDKVKVVFVQPQFDTKAAANIAKAINGAVVPLNPMEKDVFKNLEYMAGKIADAEK